MTMLQFPALDYKKSSNCDNHMIFFVLSNNAGCQLRDSMISECGFFSKSTGSLFEFWIEASYFLL